MKWIESITRPVLMLALLAAMFASPSLVEASTFVVNTNDDKDDGVCDSNHCSLREAINAANANPGPDTIAFDIPGPGLHHIRLCSKLPPMIDGETTIDGTSEPDYAGAPVVILEPRFTPSDLIFQPQVGCDYMTNGLEILSSHNIIRGLSFVAFNSLMTNSGTALKISVGTNNLIEENYFGLETSGVVRGNHKAISIGAIGNTIRANVISGNHTGINVYAISGLSNIMQSNRIGTDPSGTSTSPLLRNQYGIYISTFSSGQIIGGPGPGEGNVISGNYHGIYMYHGGNLIQGNMIGTDISGEQDLGNFVGIVIETTASNNLIGGSSPGMGNIISGNGHGIKIFSDHNTIQGNLIGTNQSGDSSIQNTFGIILQGAAASHNTIGGPGTYETNLISGNEFAGIAILDNAHSNLIQGNLIGSDISGTTPVSNFTGISLYGGFNTIGGTTNAEGNLIAFMDGSSGIRIYEPARGNIIAYNSITENAHGIIATGNTTLENTISHNEIFNNIGIGIDLYPYGITINDFGDADIGPNTVLNYPVLHVDQGVVVGQTCPGCIVEIFLSDDDPVGYGEGKTFLTQVQAQPDGSFTASVSAPGFCDLITATATDQDGNTSEFSKQLAVNCFLIEPPWLYPIFVFIITVFAGIIWAIRRLRPSTPAWLIPIGGVVGAIGLLIIAQALPAVRVDMVPRRGTIPEPPPAECLQYLDADQFAPAREDDFETYDNPSLTWAWAVEAPEGDLRWIVELHGPDGLLLKRTTPETQMLFSAFGLTPAPGNRYYWRLTLEQAQREVDRWQPLCNSTPWRSFQLGKLPEEIPVELPGEPDVCMPSVTALMNVACRAGPDKRYKDLGFLLEGESALIEGRNTETTWWWTQNPDGPGHCWIWAGAVDVECDTSELPVIAAPPLPEPTDEPVEGCTVRNRETGGIDCVTPCPRGAEPGDPCTLE